MADEDNYEKLVRSTADRILNYYKERFFKNDGSIIIGDDGSDDEIFHGIIYYEKLNVLEYAEYIYESDIYQCYIQSYSSLEKARSLEEAWENGSSLIEEEIIDRIDNCFTEEELTNDTKMVDDYFDKIMIDYCDGSLHRDRSDEVWEDSQEDWEDEESVLKEI